MWSPACLSLLPWTKKTSGVNTTKLQPKSGDIKGDHRLNIFTLPGGYGSAHYQGRLTSTQGSHTRRRPMAILGKSFQQHLLEEEYQQDRQVFRTVGGLPGSWLARIGIGIELKLIYQLIWCHAWTSVSCVRKILEWYTDGRRKLRTSRMGQQLRTIQGQRKSGMSDQPKMSQSLMTCGTNEQPGTKWALRMRGMRVESRTRETH